MSGRQDAQQPLAAAPRPVQPIRTRQGRWPGGYAAWMGRSDWIQPRHSVEYVNRSLACTCTSTAPHAAEWSAPAPPAGGEGCDHSHHGPGALLQLHSSIIIERGPFVLAVAAFSFGCHCHDSGTSVAVYYFCCPHPEVLPLTSVHNTILQQDLSRQTAFIRAFLRPPPHDCCAGRPV